MNGRVLARPNITGWLSTITTHLYLKALIKWSYEYGIP
jgi:hypothetical protein